MKLSHRSAAIAPSATFALVARTRALRAAGVDLADLSIGEPDFDTPVHIREAAAAAMAAGQTRYTPVLGTPALREAIASREHQRQGLTFGTDQAFASTGGKQVLFNAIMATVDPGDEVVMGAPCWLSYPDMVRCAGGRPVLVPCQTARRLLPMAEDLASNITSRTRLVILCSPNNPTGSMYTRDELAAIADVLRRNPHVAILCDDIYAALTYDEPAVGLLALAPELANRTLVASGCSKTYAMTGWRLGFGVGPRDWVAAIEALQGAATSGPSSVSQAAALAALTGDQSCVETMRRAFAARRDLAVEALATVDDVTLPHPGGAFYVFVDVSRLTGGTTAALLDLTAHLLDGERLAVVPGTVFGSRDHLRLSYACSEAVLRTGLERFARGLRSWPGRRA